MAIFTAKTFVATVYTFEDQKRNLKDSGLWSGRLFSQYGLTPGFRPLVDSDIQFVEKVINANGAISKGLIPCALFLLRRNLYSGKGSQLFQNPFNLRSNMRYVYKETSHDNCS